MNSRTVSRVDIALPNKVACEFLRPLMAAISELPSSDEIRTTSVDLVDLIHRRVLQSRRPSIELRRQRVDLREVGARPASDARKRRSVTIIVPYASAP